MDPFTPAPIDPFADGVPAWNAQLEQQMHGRADDEDDDDQDDEDEPDEDEDDDDDADDDEDDDDDLAGLDADELRKRLAKTQKALKTTSAADARKRVRLRNEIKELKEAKGGDGKPAPKKPAARTEGGGVTQADLDERERKRDEQHHREVMESRVETRLKDAGLSDSAIDLLIDRVDYDDLEYSRKTRRLEGFDAELERLKKSYPEVFAKTSTRKTRLQDAADDRGKSGTRGKPKTATERQAAQLAGR